MLRMREGIPMVRGAWRRHWLQAKNLGAETEAWRNILLNPGAKDAIVEGADCGLWQRRGPALKEKGISPSHTRPTNSSPLPIRWVSALALSDL